MNKLTLQINNLEALERLIGGDSQVEIEIRNSVISNFAEKHLKPLANSMEIKNKLTQIEDWIKQQVQTKINESIATFQTEGWSNDRLKNITLHSQIKNTIDSQVRLLVDDKIRTTVDEALKLWSNDAEIKRRVDQKFDYYTTEYITNEVKRRLEKVKSSL